MEAEIETEAHVGTAIPGHLSQAREERVQHLCANPVRQTPRRRRRRRAAALRFLQRRHVFLKQKNVQGRTGISERKAPSPPRPQINKGRTRGTAREPLLRMSGSASRGCGGVICGFTFLIES